MVGAPPSVPLPRRPLDPGDPGRRLRRYYENDLGWPTAPGPPLGLVVGPRFDVLDVPAEAGRAGLRHLAPSSPVAVRGDRMRLLVAPGSAEELPGLLEWLEWGALAPGLDLGAVGVGGVVEAPGVAEVAGVAGVAEGPGVAGLAGVADVAGVFAAPGGSVVTEESGASGARGAAVWLRPPSPDCEVEASLPTMSAMGGAGGAGRAPDLVRLVDTVATACHRVRLRRARGQALAFS
ncbi:SCO3374 family protein [Streptomyces sp. NPDC006997]|uniref:SCO3374 family protein n=1 Tax=Streptomyces sp. NPDC006997 TaxID=3155356 RepID=UPI0033E2B269